MSTVAFNPWRARAGFPVEFRQVFDRLWKDSADTDGVVNQWTPRVDIKEEETRFVILADVPGVEPAAIDIQMEKGVLSIKGERSTVNKEEADGYTRTERVQGAFYRRFSLPDSADAEGITASGRNGVLEIVIPKKPESAPRKITVQ